MSLYLTDIMPKTMKAIQQIFIPKHQLQDLNKSKASAEHPCPLLYQNSRGMNQWRQLSIYPAKMPRTMQ